MRVGGGLVKGELILQVAVAAAPMPVTEIHTPRAFRAVAVLGALRRTPIVAIGKAKA